MSGLPSAKRPCMPPHDTPAGAVGVLERDGERIEMLWSPKHRVWCFAKSDETPMQMAIRINRLWGYHYGWPSPGHLKRHGWRLVSVSPHYVTNVTTHR